jgi:hypothetical protein
VHLCGGVSHENTANPFQHSKNRDETVFVSSNSSDPKLGRNYQHLIRFEVSDASWIIQNNAFSLSSCAQRFSTECPLLFLAHKFRNLGLTSDFIKLPLYGIVHN